jgi:hypothetical protein
MTDIFKDGGPAFPFVPTIEAVFTSTGTEHRPIGTPGMTLRDWFAGQAIAGVCASDIDLESADWNGCAAYAYEIADAMLKAREAK